MRIIICGLCDTAQHYHTDEFRKQSELICDRDRLDTGWGLGAYDLDTKFPKFDYERTVSDNAIVDLPVYDPSGTESLIVALKGGSHDEVLNHRLPYRFGTPQGEYVSGQYVDEIDYEDESREQMKLERWRDVTHRSYGSIDEFICTPTLEQHQSAKMGDATEVVIRMAKDKVQIEPHSLEVDETTRNAYVEGNPGFTTVKLLDDVLTRKYHARLLNVFADKVTHEIRVGSMRIEVRNGVRYMVCVRNDCNAKKGFAFPSLDGLSDEDVRKTMEDWTLALIRHGNNHAAKFIRERPEFYKVHAVGCDLKCDPDRADCIGHITTKEAAHSELELLWLHNLACTNSKCLCAGYLAKEMPALAS